MNSQAVSHETIDKIKSFGFDVYMRDPKDSWLYFTDGKHIGYLQNDNYGYSLATVHKPNQTTGTGFDAGKMLLTLDKETLERCFDFAPGWAHGRDRQTVVKYKDMAEFIASNSFNKEYKLV